MPNTSKNNLQQRIYNFPDRKLTEAFGKIEDYNKEAQNYIREEFQRRGLVLPKPILPQSLSELEKLEAELRQEPIPVVLATAGIRTLECFPSITAIPFKEKDGEKIFFQSDVISANSSIGKRMQWKKMWWSKETIMGGIALSAIFLAIIMFSPDSFLDNYLWHCFAILGVLIVSISALLSKSTHQFIIKQKKDGQIVVLIDQPFEMTFYFPFSYQYYNEFFTYNGMKRVYLLFQKEGQSFAIGYSLGTFQSFPLGCQVVEDRMEKTTVYYLKGRKGNRSAVVRKILDTIRKGV